MLVIVALLVVAVVVALILAAMRPNVFSVQRSIGIRAPADRIIGKDFARSQARTKATAEG